MSVGREHVQDTGNTWLLGRHAVLEELFEAPALREDTLDASMAARISGHAPPPTLRAVRASLAREFVPLGGIVAVRHSRNAPTETRNTHNENSQEPTLALEDPSALPSWMAPAIATRTDWSQYKDPLRAADDAQAVHLVSATLSAISKRRLKKQGSASVAINSVAPVETVCDHSPRLEHAHFQAPAGGRGIEDAARNDAWVRAECTRLEHEIESGCSWRWRPAAFTPHIAAFKTTSQDTSTKPGIKSEVHKRDTDEKAAVGTAASVLARNPWLHPRLKYTVLRRIATALQRARVP